MITIKNVSFVFNDGKVPLEVLRNISFSIQKNENVSILGPSGCGKSTLLRCISGFLTPETGNINLNGYSPNQFIEKKEIGFSDNTS